LGKRGHQADQVQQQTQCGAGNRAQEFASHSSHSKCRQTIGTPDLVEFE
jgi:hypothetical protein